MQTLQINIKNQYAIQILKGMEKSDLIEINKKVGAKKLSKSDKKWVEGLKSALREVELHEKGIIKLKDAKDLLNEL